MDFFGLFETFLDVFSASMNLRVFSLILFQEIYKSPAAALGNQWQHPLIIFVSTKKEYINADMLFFIQKLGKFLTVLNIIGGC